MIYHETIEVIYPDFTHKIVQITTMQPGDIAALHFNYTVPRTVKNDDMIHNIVVFSNSTLLRMVPSQENIKFDFASIVNSSAKRSRNAIAIIQFFQFFQAVVRRTTGTLDNTNDRAITRLTFLSTVSNTGNCF